ncbi:hypothetical protein MKZ24_31705 [Paenibacillus sp. FSL R7-0297]|uniref:hypothetical protein n=1 Tax=unclassified Paenibacillus TaxID=185978 RepID=UPI0004F8E8BE|nr:hypothetical protein [Paenibacillus sp. FSL R5-0912]AIQ39645.1 hypothetical protein R50912_06030 [Paenibacillus sp. FSL R5-0912]
MFRSLKRRIDNANQMQRMRSENPVEFRRALEKHTREQQAPDNTLPVQSGPVIRFTRWFLYLLTALILLVIFLGVPQADNPIFSLLSFGLLLSLLYMTAGLAHPSILFFRKKRSRMFALELFGLISGLLILLMTVFHT